MDRRRYLVYSGIGGALWAIGVTVLGSLLGRFEFVKKNIEIMLLLVVAVSVVPIAVEFLRERARRGREGGSGAAPATASGPASDGAGFPPAVNGHEAAHRSAYDGQAFGQQPYVQSGYEGYQGYAQPGQPQQGYPHQSDPQPQEHYQQYQQPAYPQQGYPQQHAQPQYDVQHPQQQYAQPQYDAQPYDPQQYAQPAYPQQGYEQGQPPSDAAPPDGENLPGRPRRGGRHA
jgi:membrane-associated protein